MGSIKDCRCLLFASLEFLFFVVDTFPEMVRTWTSSFIWISSADGPPLGALNSALLE